jgi:hypothetical protein
MENSNIKLSHLMAVNVLVSVVMNLVLSQLFFHDVEKYPIILGSCSLFLTYAFSIFCIEAYQLHKLRQSMKSSAAKPLEAPVEASKITETQAVVPEVAAAVEAPKPVESHVEVAVDSKPTEEKKPEPAAPVSNRIIMKKKAPKR